MSRGILQILTQCRTPFTDKVLSLCLVISKYILPRLAQGKSKSLFCSSVLVRSCRPTLRLMFYYSFQLQILVLNCRSQEMFQASDGEGLKHCLSPCSCQIYLVLSCLTISGTAQMGNIPLPSWGFVHISN